MKKVLSVTYLVLLASLVTLFAATANSAEKPVKHLDLPDVTSYEQAKKVFAETSAQLQSKTKLDAGELHQIHMITYSLEKAVAYFSENMKDKQQADAKKIAEVVELVHLGSENNRTEETKIYLSEYSKLAKAFSKTL